MALLGAQLVLTLIMISVMQKLGSHYSFARWLLCSTGLIRYLYPTDDELRQLANVPKDKLKFRKNSKLIQNGASKSETFHVPRNLEIQLESTKVTCEDIIHLRYFVEYQWLLDFTVYGAMMYTLTEVYQMWFPITNEINLSVLWCTLVLGFALKVLVSLTVQYFKGEESVGERSTCIVMGFLYLLISMIVLITDENTLELGIENAYSSFNKSASIFLSKQGIISNGPASKIVLKFFLALWCGFLGALFTFPGLRIARMHWDLIKYYKERKFVQIALNLSFALPFLLIILWVKPFSRDYLTTRVFTGMSEPLFNVHSFETFRLVAVIATMCLKLILMPWYLQAYLDMAYHRIEQQKKEAGRITNIDLQKKIAAVFYYLCVVTLQYVIPIIMCIYVSLVYKTLGGYTWRHLFMPSSNLDECPFGEIPVNNDILTETVNQSAEQLHLALDNLKQVFTEDVFRGMFGFATWWCCFLYFATNSVGMIYQSYFTDV